MSPVPVAALNALTSRWCSALGDGDTVLSGVGVWPLLAILADAAGGDARAELGAAIGVDPGLGGEAARELDDLLASLDGITTAFGLWTAARLAVRDEWVSTLPTGTHASLTDDPAADQAAADAWVAARTNGRLTEVPVAIDEETMLLLVGTLTIDVTWREPFNPPRRDEFGTGAWRERAYAPMQRTTDDLSIVRASADLTLVRVVGTDGIDVELALGLPDASAATVLTAALARFQDRKKPLRKGVIAPGITVETSETYYRARPSCRLAVPPFTVRAAHDLLADPDVFGIRTVTDRNLGHLPGISDTPLVLGQARQSIVAAFGQWGFTASAVTLVSLIGSVVPPSEVRAASVTFDRPFGFLAIHRDTGLVLAAGWVAEPMAMADCDFDRDLDPSAI